MPNEFNDRYGPLAESITAGTGIFPETVLATASLESGQGKSELAAKHNNLFGIKATPDWSGKTVTMTTGENTGKSNATTVSAKFRAYDSPEDSMKDYVAFLQQNPRYKKAGVFDAASPQAQAVALQNAGYATDKDYAKKVMSNMPLPSKFAPLIDKMRSDGVPEKEINTYINSRIGMYRDLGTEPPPQQKDQYSNRGGLSEFGTSIYNGLVPELAKGLVVLPNLLLGAAGSDVAESMTNKSIDWINENITGYIDPANNQGLLKLDENNNIQFTDAKSMVNGLGQGIGSLLSFLVPATALAKAGKLGAVTSTIASGTVMSMPMLYESGRRAGLSNSDNARMTLALAPIIGSIEAVGGAEAGAIRRLLGREAEEAGAKELTKSTLTEALKKYGGKGVLGADDFKAAAKESLQILSPKSWANRLTQGKVIKQGIGEAGEEYLQNFVQKGGEQMYDAMYGDNEVGKGKYGTELFVPELDKRGFGFAVDGWKYNKEEYVDDMGAAIYGGILGHGLSSITTPVVNQSLYGYMDLATKKGMLPKAMEGIASIADGMLKEGKIDEAKAKQITETAAKMGEVSAMMRSVDGGNVTPANSYDVYNWQYNERPKYEAAVSEYNSVKEDLLKTITETPNDVAKITLIQKTLADNYNKYQRAVQSTEAINKHIRNVVASGKQTPISETLGGINKAQFNWADNDEMKTLLQGYEQPEQGEQVGLEQLIGIPTNYQGVEGTIVKDENGYGFQATGEETIIPLGADSNINLDERGIEYEKDLLTQKKERDAVEPTPEANTEDVSPMAEMDGAYTPTVAEVERVSGKFYRAETGYVQDRGTTAADVLNFEADENGNQDAIDARERMKELGIDLTKVPHSDIVWVTKNKEDAERYGEEVGEYEVNDGVVVIPDDGDGGMLVLKNFKASEQPISEEPSDLDQYFNSTKELSDEQAEHIRQSTDAIESSIISGDATGIEEAEIIIGFDEADDSARRIRDEESREGDTTTDAEDGVESDIQDVTDGEEGQQANQVQADEVREADEAAGEDSGATAEVSKEDQTRISNAIKYSYPEYKIRTGENIPIEEYRQLRMGKVKPAESLGEGTTVIKDSDSKRQVEIKVKKKAKEANAKAEEKGISLKDQKKDLVGKMERALEIITGKTTPEIDEIRLKVKEKVLDENTVRNMQGELTPEMITALESEGIKVTETKATRIAELETAIRANDEKIKNPKTPKDLARAEKEKEYLENELADAKEESKQQLEFHIKGDGEVRVGLEAFADTLEMTKKNFPTSETPTKKEYRFRVQADSENAGKPIASNTANFIQRILAGVFPNIKVNFISNEEFKAKHNSEALGVTNPDGTIDFNRDKITKQTQVHEFGHIFTSWAKRYAPKLYQQGLNLAAKETELLNRIRKQYPNLKGDALLEEALVTIIGEKGEEKLSKGLLDRFSDWVKNLWDSVRTFFGKKGVMLDDTWDTDTLDKFAYKVASQLLKGSRISDITSEEVEDIEKDLGIPRAQYQVAYNSPYEGEYLENTYGAQEEKIQQPTVYGVAKKINSDLEKILTSTKKDKVLAVRNYISPILNDITEKAAKNRADDPEKKSFTKNLESFQSKMESGQYDDELREVADKIEAGTFVFFNDELQDVSPDTRKMFSDLLKHVAQQQYLAANGDDLIVDKDTKITSDEANRLFEEEVGRWRERLNAMKGNKATAPIIDWIEKKYLLKIANVFLWAKMMTGQEKGLMADAAHSISEAGGEQALIQQNADTLLAPLYKAEWLTNGSQTLHPNRKLSELDTEEINGVPLTTEEQFNMFMALQQSPELRERMMGGDKKMKFYVKEFQGERDGQTVEIGYPEYEQLLGKFDQHWDEVRDTWGNASDYLFNKVDDTYFLENGVHLAKVVTREEGQRWGLYLPLIHGKGEDSIKDYLKRNEFVNSIASHKVRNPDPEQVYYAGSFFDIINGYVQDNSRYAAYAIPVRNMNILLKNNEKFLEENKMTDYINWWNKTERHLFEGEEDIAGGVGRSLITGFVLSRLGLNPFVDLKQLTSVLLATTNIPSKYVIQSQKELFSTIKDQLANYDMFTDWVGRNKTDIPILEEMKKHSPYALSRIMQGVNEVQKYLSLANKKKFKIPIINKEVPIQSDDVIKNIRTMDTAVGAMIWNAAKLYVDNEYGIEKGTDAYWKKVDEIYTKTVTESQSSIDEANRPYFSKQPKVLNKALSLFAGQGFAVFNAFVSRTIDYLNNPTPLTRMKLAKTFMNSFVLATVGTALVDTMRHSMLGGGDKDKDKSKLDDYTIRAMYQNLPILSPFIDAAVTKTKTRGFGDITYPAMDILNEGIDAVAKTIKQDPKAIGAYAEFVGGWAGIPMTPVRAAKKLAE